MASVILALGRARSFLQRASHSFERPQLMIEHALEETKFATQVLEPMFDRLED